LLRRLYAWHLGSFCALNLYVQDIIRLPRLFKFLQKPLAQLISVLRAPKSKESYASIGGGSPLLKITNEQVYKIPFTFLSLTKNIQLICIIEGFIFLFSDNVMGGRVDLMLKNYVNFCACVCKE
jgi:Ferrochelatase